MCVMVTFALAQHASPSNANDGGQEAKSPSTLNVATNWFELFSHGDVTALKARTRYPFVYRDTGGSLCKGGRAEEASKLPAVLGCIYKKDALGEDLKDKDTGRSPWEILTKESLPRWAKRWLKKTPAGTTPVFVALDANGSYHHLILFVAGDSVVELWKDTTFDRD